MKAMDYDDEQDGRAFPKVGVALGLLVVLGGVAFFGLIAAGSIPAPWDEGGTTRLDPVSDLEARFRTDPDSWDTPDPGLPPLPFNDEGLDLRSRQRVRVPAEERLPEAPAATPPPTPVNPATRPDGEPSRVIEHYVPAPGMTPPTQQPYNPAFPRRSPDGL